MQPYIQSGMPHHIHHYILHYTTLNNLYNLTFNNTYSILLRTDTTFEHCQKCREGKLATRDARMLARCLTSFMVGKKTWPTPPSTSAHLQTLLVCTSLLQGTCICWAEARVEIARMTLTIKLEGNWNSFQVIMGATCSGGILDRNAMQ